MAQNPLAATIAVTPTGAQVPVKSTALKYLANAIDSGGNPAVPTLNADGGWPVHVNNTVNTVNTTPALSTTLNITAATLVKAGAGTVGTVCVVVKGTGNGTLNDCATTGAAAASNAFFALDDTATSATVLNFPTSLGIVVTPGAGQTICISWK
jgi:VCBS repeat-containing protein